jgi:hypothetical protein
MLVVQERDGNVDKMFIKKCWRVQKMPKCLKVSEQVYNKCALLNISMSQETNVEKNKVRIAIKQNNCLK